MFLLCSVTSKFTIHITFKTQCLHTAYKCIHCDLTQFSPKPCDIRLITHSVDQVLRAVLNQTPGHKINFQQSSELSFYPITSFIHHSSWSRTCGFYFPLRKMKEGYLKGRGYSANTCHLLTNNGTPLLGHLCMGCWEQSLGPTEVALGLTECYKSMPLHYFHLLVLILRHTENKANQFPKISEDRPYVCHPTALSPLKIK